MTIFTKEVKEEIKKFLPHYIVISGFLIISIVTSNLITHAIMFNINNKPNFEDKGQEFQQEVEEGTEEGILPSEIEFGLPYAEAIKDKSKPLLIEFYADWCQYSRKLTPIIAELSDEMVDINFTSIDTQVNENYYLAQKYKVDKFPFVVLLDQKTGETQELFLKEYSFTKEGLRQQIIELKNNIK